MQTLPPRVQFGLTGHCNCSESIIQSWYVVQTLTSSGIHGNEDGYQRSKYDVLQPLDLNCLLGRRYLPASHWAALARKVLFEVREQ